MIRKLYKPDNCPYCNSKDIVFVSNMIGEVYCVCGNCAKTPSSVKVYNKSKVKAITKWNEDCREFMSKVIN